MPKLYKTAQGRTVDIGALLSQNERTRAVGNMKVNARGDVIDNQNQTVVSRNRQVKRTLDSGVDQNNVAKTTKTTPDRPKKDSLTPDTIKNSKVFDNQAEPSASTQGLAAALARANQPKESK